MNTKSLRLMKMVLCLIILCIFLTNCAVGVVPREANSFTEIGSNVNDTTHNATGQNVGNVRESITGRTPFTANIDERRPMKGDLYRMVYVAERGLPGHAFDHNIGYARFIERPDRNNDSVGLFKPFR